MITAGEYDISHAQGATFDRTFTVNGLNLTGYTAAMQVRDVYDSSTVLFTPTVTISVPGGTAGTVSTITINTSSTATAGVAIGSYGYDLWLTQGTVTDPFLYGSYNIGGRFTR